MLLSQLELIGRVIKEDFFFFVKLIVYLRVKFGCNAKILNGDLLVS